MVSQVRTGFSVEGRLPYRTVTKSTPVSSPCKKGQGLEWRSNSVVFPFTFLSYLQPQKPASPQARIGYPAEVGALFTMVFSIRVSRVRVTLTVTVRVSRVSVMVSVRDSVK